MRLMTTVGFLLLSLTSFASTTSPVPSAGELRAAEELATDEGFELESLVRERGEEQGIAQWDRGRRRRPPQYPPYYPPHPPRQRPRPARVQCFANDYYGRSFSAVGYYAPQVQQEALNQCHYYSRSGCYVQGCRYFY